jgi:hypothetical protein
MPLLEVDGKNLVNLQVAACTNQPFALLMTEAFGHQVGEMLNL